MKELEDKSVFELEKIAQDANSSDTLKGAAAAMLTVEYNHANAKEKFIKWAQVAYKYDQGNYTPREYTSISEAFIPSRLDNPQVYWDIIAKAVVRKFHDIEFRKSKKYMESFDSEYVLHHIVAFLCVGNDVFKTPTLIHEAEAIKALNKVAIQVENFKPNLSRPRLPLSNAKKCLEEMFFHFGIEATKTPNDKKYIKYTNPGFIFIEYALELIPSVYALEILNRCLDVGFDEAESSIQRSKPAVGKPLYATVLYMPKISSPVSYGSMSDSLSSELTEPDSPDSGYGLLQKKKAVNNVSVTSSAARAYMVMQQQKAEGRKHTVAALDLKPGEKIQIFDANYTVRKNSPAVKCKIKVLSDGREIALNNDQFSLPMAPAGWIPKEILDMEANAERSSTSENEKGKIAAHLTLIFHSEYLSLAIERDLDKAKRWAIAAAKYDQGNYTDKEYYSLARMFAQHRLNNPELYFKFLVRAIVPDFKKVAGRNDGGHFVWFHPIQELLKFVCFGDPEFKGPTHLYDIEAVNALSNIALQTGEIVRAFSLPQIACSNGLDYFNVAFRDYASFIFYGLDKASAKPYKSYRTPGFIFIEIMLEDYPSIFALEILKRCAAIGFVEAKEYLERSNITHGKPMFAKLLNPKFEGNKAITCKYGDEVQVLLVIPSGKIEDTKYKVRFINNSVEIILPAIYFTLPNSAKHCEPKPLLIAAHTAPMAEIKPASPSLTSDESYLPMAVHKSSVDMSTALLQQREQTHYTEQQINALNAKFAEACQLITQSLHTAQEAERLALETIASMRKLEGKTELELNKIKVKMSIHEQYMFNVIKRLNELGSAYNVLSAKIAKSEELDTIREALHEQGHKSALTFLRYFVANMEHKTNMSTIFQDGRVSYDYGRRGLVLDVLVGIANLVPVPGVGAGASVVKTMVNFFQENVIKAESKKFLEATSGSIVDMHKLATAIGIAILKYNGYDIDQCSEKEAQDLARAAKDSAVKAIEKLKANGSGGKIFAEDIAFEILSGLGMDTEDEIVKFNLQALSADGKLFGSKCKPKTTHDRDWLNQVLLSHANGRPPMSFEPLPQIGDGNPFAQLTTQVPVASTAVRTDRRAVIS